MNPHQDKGHRGEREACRLLAHNLGFPVRRRANEGIREDIGDLVGLPDTCVQVAHWADKQLHGVPDKAHECAEQQARLGATHGVTLVRLDRGGWVAVLTLQQLEALNVELATTATGLDHRAPAAEVLRVAQHVDCGWLSWRGVWVTGFAWWAECWREATA